MAALSIQVPYPVFYDRDGQPLDNGNIYIGDANLDPVTNPLQVYYDEALTIPASQPLKTSNGYVYRNGTPTQLYVDAVNFSILVNDSKNTLVYSFPDGTGVGASAFGITYLPPFTGGVATTVGDKLAQTVSVLDFGADPTGVADSAPAFRTAGASNRVLIVPPGTYFFNSQQTAPPAAFDDPNVLYQNLDNFTIYAYGATFVVGDDGAFSSIFHWDRCNNIAFYGGIMQGNKFGQISSQENCALTLSSVVQFHIADVYVESGFGGIGAGIVGDWMVDGVFENIRMKDIGIAIDTAYLKNVTFRNINATGADFNGNSGAGQTGQKGISLIQDAPNASNNFTGITFTESENVNYLNCSMRNFNTGAAISSGNGISFVGCDLSYNPGDGVSPGLGAFVHYVNGGSFSSVGAPVHNITFASCKFIGNGTVGVGAAGILLDAASSAGVDEIANVTVVGCQFDDNITQGIGAGAGGLANLTNITAVGNSFSGAAQLFGIAPNLNAIINSLNNDNEANVSTTITFRDFVYHDNNKNLYWADSSGNQQPIFGVSPSDVTFLKPASGAATVEISNFAGTATQFQVDNDANNAVLIRVNGSVQRVTVGAADSGGTGYRVLRVPN